MRTALITIAHHRHDHLHRQRTMIKRSSVAVDRHVVVAMDDPELSESLGETAGTTVISLDRRRDGLPLAAARNAGAAAARADGADLLIFLDVDCLPDEALVAEYRRAALDPSTSGSLLCGPVAYLPPPEPVYDLTRLDDHPPHPARPAPPAGRRETDGDPRLFWSLSFATTATTWRRIGGFDERYVGYGAEDTDFGFRARHAGVSLTWVGGATAYHQWHPSESPPVRHLDDILRNGEIFARRWGWWPMEGWLASFAADGLITFDERDGRWIRTAPIEDAVDDHDAGERAMLLGRAR